ncbi:MAG: NAD(P)/FAD-dependent oxidoreductase [Chitinophagia bacterium]|nr:NAD(P)/FAD-dependent oxidoreductase [Chitinophagia bacterium]
MHRKAVITLNSVLPDFEQRFKAFPRTLVLKNTKVHYKDKMILFNWVNESYTCPRMDLDNFLLETVKDVTTTDVFTGTAPDKITVSDKGVQVSIKNSDTLFTGKLIIGADGAQSTVAKQLASRQQIDKKHYLGAVRAYYENVDNIDPSTSEVYFNSKFKLNYLWVFPVHGNLVNVGFGLLSQDISEKRINLKEAFYEYFETSPQLQAKFKNARIVGALDGFGVPLGSNIGTVAGDRFMLIGDAASLSNPLSGTGMGNAVLSGKLAGEQAIRCFEQDNFSHSAMHEYELRLHNAIIKELTNSYKAQRLLSKMPFLLNGVFAVGNNKRVKKYLQSVV